MSILGGGEGLRGFKQIPLFEIGVIGQRGDKISRSKRTPLLRNPSQMSSDTKYSGGLDTLAVCKGTTPLGIQNKFQRTAENRKATEEVQ